MIQRLAASMPHLALEGGDAEKTTPDAIFTAQMAGLSGA